MGAKKNYNAKTVRPMFALSIGQSEKAKAVFGTQKEINAKAKELFIKNLEKS